MLKTILKSLLVFTLLLPLLAPSCKKEEKVMAVTFDDKLLKSQKWYLSYEEIKGDTIYYRPESYDFPPSRGREGFQFLEETGKATYYGIGPADAPEKLDATWTYENGILTIDIAPGQFGKPRQMVINLLELNSEKLEGLQIY